MQNDLLVVPTQLLSTYILSNLLPPTTDKKYLHILSSTVCLHNIVYVQSLLVQCIVYFRSRARARGRAIIIETAGAPRLVGTAALMGRRGSLARLMKSPRPHVSLRATAVAPRLIGAADGAAAARRQCRWGLRGSLARLMKSPRPHVSLRATAVAPRLVGKGAAHWHGLLCHRGPMSA